MSEKIKQLRDKLTNKIEQFRNGMFVAPSRTYAEKYMEPIIRKYFGWDESDTNQNDAINADGEFVEIKCSKVLWEKKEEKNIPLTEIITLENENIVLKRLIKFDDCYD